MPTEGRLRHIPTLVEWPVSREKGPTAGFFWTNFGQFVGWMEASKEKWELLPVLARAEGGAGFPIKSEVWFKAGRETAFLE